MAGRQGLRSDLWCAPLEARYSEMGAGPAGADAARRRVARRLDDQARCCAGAPYDQRQGGRRRSRGFFAGEIAVGGAVSEGLIDAAQIWSDIRASCWRPRPPAGGSLEPKTMTNAVPRFVGGSPAMVAVRLIVVSFVVGIVLETFGFDPASVLSEAVRAVREVIELGFSDLHQVGRILLTGAMVVIPVWLVLRLVDSTGRR